MTNRNIVLARDTVLTLWLNNKRYNELSLETLKELDEIGIKLTVNALGTD